MSTNLAQNLAMPQSDNHSGSGNLNDTERVFKALDRFHIEIPSLGFSNIGTRFGKIIQPATATNLEEKFADAGQVHALPAVVPRLRCICTGIHRTP